MSSVCTNIDDSISNCSESEQLTYLLTNYNTMGMNINSELKSFIKKIKDFDLINNGDSIEDEIEQFKTQIKLHFSELISYANNISLFLENSEENKSKELFNRITRNIIDNLNKYDTKCNEFDYIFLPKMLEHKIKINSYTKCLIDAISSPTNEEKSFESIIDSENDQSNTEGKLDDESDNENEDKIPNNENLIKEDIDIAANEENDNNTNDAKIDIMQTFSILVTIVTTVHISTIPIYAIDTCGKGYKDVWFLFHIGNAIGVLSFYSFNSKWFLAFLDLIIIFISSYNVSQNTWVSDISLALLGFCFTFLNIENKLYLSSINLGYIHSFSFFIGFILHEEIISYNFIITISILHIVSIFVNTPWYDYDYKIREFNAVNSIQAFLYSVADFGAIALLATLDESLVFLLISLILKHFTYKGILICIVLTLFISTVITIFDSDYCLICKIYQQILFFVKAMHDFVFVHQYGVYAFITLLINIFTGLLSYFLYL